MDGDLLTQAKQYMAEGCYTLAYHSLLLAIRDVDQVSQDDIVYVSESLAECASYIEDPSMRYEAQMTCDHFSFTDGRDAITEY